MAMTPLEKVMMVTRAARPTPDDFMPFVGISPDRAIRDISQKTGRPVRFQPHEEADDVLA